MKLIFFKGNAGHLMNADSENVNNIRTHFFLTGRFGVPKKSICFSLL